MADEPITPGFVQETLIRLRRIQKASQIEGQPAGGVTLTYDLNANVVSGTVIFPIIQVDDGGGLVVKAVDFVE
jgi:hypothetical protein